MIVYSGIKSQFMDSVENDTIAIEIKNKILEKMGRHTADNEFHSWCNSLQYMYRVLNDSDIPEDAGVAIEYNIPQTAKRVDFMISGYDDYNQSCMTIVELKQWETLELVRDSENLVETFTGNAVRQVVHPSYQASSYAQMISDYNTTVQDEKIKLFPCAYLHNYERHAPDPVDDEQYDDVISKAPIFTKYQGKELRHFIKTHLKAGDNGEILYRIDHGAIRPSKSLQNSIASMLEGNKEFIMIDEQKVVFENVKRLSMLSQKDGKKRTIICKGGPGTGKSVIAVQLLSELTQCDQFVQYVSKNSAPRQVYLSKLKGKFKKSSIDNMFVGSGTFTDVGPNVVDTLLVDEAHRLNEKSGMFHNKGVNQVLEVIQAARCSVFFIDENQRVTMDDIGSVDEIKKWAQKLGSEVYKYELVSQFRCNGSNGYLSWIDDVLDIRHTANFSLDGLDFDFEVCHSPEELKDKIVRKNAINNKSRILAGYCWEWPNEERNNTNYHDIKIGNFGISWNLSEGQAFAINPNSINEAGCIHTTQGLEFDYVGILIGDDLRYKDGKVITDFTKRAKTDQSIKGIKQMYKKDATLALKRADEIIKNTYRTLMTRGMKGCYVYCTDKELEKYLIERQRI